MTPDLRICADHLVEQRRFDVAFAPAHDALVVDGHHVVADQQFLEQLLAGAQADRLDFDLAQSSPAAFLRVPSLADAGSAAARREVPRPSTDTYQAWWRT